MPDQVG